jgi:DNA polymerase-1
MKHIITYYEEFLARLPKNAPIAIDTETKSLQDRTMVGFSIAYGKYEYYIAVRDEFLENMDITKAQKLLNYIMQNCNYIVFHNSSFDIPVLKRFGVKIPNNKQFEDTLIISNLLDENMRHGLKALTKKYLAYQMIELKELCGTGKKQIGFHEVQDKKKIKYATDDAKYTLKLYNLFNKELKKIPEVQAVYTQIERPLLPVVAQMHVNGARINVEQVQKIAAMCQKKISAAEKKLRSLMGEDINFSSSKQLREYFIDKIKMPVLRRSEKTNAPSVDKEVLEAYAESNKEAKLLLEFRKYSKIYSTFIPALTPQKWDSKNMSGYIYTSFNQAGTVTGRFSSSSPNLQNIPHEDKFLPNGKLNPEYLGIREAFIPEEEHIFVGADFSQIELRVLAHFSQDDNLLHAYNTGVDIHQQTADALSIKRYDAKTINFGLVYGMGAKTLGKRIKISQEEAQHYIDKYFETYPRVKLFWKRAEQDFRVQGYVQTISGRKRRRSQHFFAKDDYEQGAEIRSAINSIIQGTAADLIKIAMVNMHKALNSLGAKLILIVHDEVLVSCPIKNAQAVYAIIERSMLEAASCLSVPVDVDIKYGRTWAEAHGDGIKLKKVKK